MADSAWVIDSCGKRSVSRQTLPCITQQIVYVQETRGGLLVPHGVTIGQETYVARYARLTGVLTATRLTVVVGWTGCALVMIVGQSRTPATTEPQQYPYTMQGPRVVTYSRPNIHSNQHILWDVPMSAIAEYTPAPPNTHVFYLVPEVIH